ncbi:MAG TPA: NAD(P)/FAD-dependent oxidoreductase [Fimbriimonadaceae bacterium]|nr:NAD(P)/FAD-dependent oxidoreductase [Fimbriimonadaceae bacterium]HRJ95648.1 NAD(P)/FAD-dependent oxidoreductase [Fimbriimonadaceae bacterium]
MEAHAGCAARPRIVIVGGGFGGIEAAKALRRTDAEVLVVDRSNHFLFQPLLYQVATAGLSPAQIATPIRRILRRQSNVRVLLAEVVGIDLDKREVICAEGREAFDYLILATGARHSYFGHPDWETRAPGLKNLDDAIRIRRKILVAFEDAERAASDEERKAAMTFVVVGGGATGVELAGSIAELARRTLVHDFDRVRPESARVVLIEAGPRVLPSFAESLGEKAVISLHRLGVEVWLGTKVVNIAADEVDVDGPKGPQRLLAQTVLWGAGVQASPVAGWLGAKSDGAGRVRVGADCSVPGHPEVFVIGDAMTIGEGLPGVAQVAMQQGRYVARVIEARLRRKPAPPPFAYRDLGNMATIGRSAAIFQRGRLMMSGFLAWLGWLFVHLMQLVGHRNRVSVFVEWMWAYLVWERGARLITPVGRPDEH